MHYEQTAFTSNGGITIATLDQNYQATIGQRVAPSFFDVKRINFAYCNSTCPTKLDCQNSGYTDPKNCGTCRCPTAFGGNYCQQAAGNPSACGAGDRLASSNLQTITASGSLQCNYVIRAPANKRIFFQITSMAFSRQSPCTVSYVEVKYGSDMGRVGARFCTSSPTISLSATNVLAVIYNGQSNTRFSMNYRYDPPDGANTDETTTTTTAKTTTTTTKQTTTTKPVPVTEPPPSTTTTVKTTTKPVTTTTTATPMTTRPTPKTTRATPKTTRRTTPPRTTKRTVRTTTRRPTTRAIRTTTKKPVPPPPKCTAWTRCSAKCGGCGKRTRRCNGKVQTQFCNMNPCQGGYCCRPFFYQRNKTCARPRANDLKTPIAYSMFPNGNNTGNGRGGKPSKIFSLALNTMPSVPKSSDTPEAASTSLLQNQPVSDEPGPSSNAILDDVFCDPDTLIATIASLFSENTEFISKSLFNLLGSNRTNDEIQMELIELLGFDHFDFVAKLLENRDGINESIRNQARSTTIKRTAHMAAATTAPSMITTLSSYNHSITVQTESQAELRKVLKKEERKAKKELKQVQNNLTEEEKAEFEQVQRDIIRQRQLEIEALKYAPKQDSARNVKNYPYVFDASIQGRQTFLAINGVKYILPEGTVRESYKTHEEVLVPPSESKGVTDIEHVYVKNMDEIGQLGFQGIEKLNVIQSIVFEKAYKTRENLLICAPTGAGKTNIAMLTILNTVHEHRYSNGQIAKDDFKIIYIAPMKALATEMTENFGKRLEPLGLKVRELTGDTVLSRKEIEETQMLILTPEKWDVVTRKATPDTALTSLVRLLIIDEVHLLHDDRGPVIETIVARTLRQVEISQSPIRIVGLSATLPNYVDVANFLRVNPEKGLFYFDGRFRPVPLTQKFIGCRSQSGVRDMQTTMDEVCYDQVIDFVKRGHQVLVFVHTRNGTARLAQAFKDMAAKLGQLEIFLPRAAADKTRAYTESQKKMNTCRSKQLVEFFRLGFGIHHAGLVRHDRILMEKVFSAGHINVLFCTATLAWGVNLPAHAVVIRGTDIFDAEKGAFTDLGVLDVQQIFGRAGRPQFETEGHGIIITSSSKLDKYLGMLTKQNPIESNFFKKIHDNLNAEISLGTVTNIDEAVNWLRYTYYYTRATLNPMAYGLNHVILQKDPQLRNHLTEMLAKVAVDLDKNKMIRYNAPLGHVYSTDLGRIASNFYVSYETVELLNDAIASAQGGLPVALTEYMPDDMVREDECLDLEELVACGCMLPIRGGGLASVPGKVNVLMQAYISRTFIRSFTLSSESLYVQQNAGRLCRAIFEMVLRSGWAHATISFLTMAKCIEKRLWPNQCCLRQLLEYGYVQLSWIEKIEQRKLTDTKLMDLTDKEIGYMLSCDGRKVFDALRMIPRLEVTATIKPITYTIVQVEAQLTPIFTWNDRVLGKGGAQAFWITIENIDENRIIHHERLSLSKKKIVKKETQYLTFTIPVRDRELTNRFQLRVASDFFFIDDTVYPLSLHDCIMPKSFKAHTDLLPLQPLPISILKNPAFESLYSFPFFNPIQTQIFHTLYKTDESALVGAPTGSGKTLCAELTIYRLLQEHRNMKCAYIAPLKALVRERVLDWKEKFGRIGIKVIEVSGDYTPDMNTLNASTILVTTPEKWDGITRSWSTREYVRQVGLIVLDEIHLLGVERGAVLEAIITRLKLLTKRTCFRETPVRLVGLSTALANAGDVGEWLGIKDEGLFNFRPSVRPVPIEVHIKGFPGQHYCPRMALMNKPAFKDILTYSPTKPVLVFVASRRQTRLTAMAFVSHLVAEDNPRQWLHMEMDELNTLLASVKDENLKLVLPFGIGMHHAGLSAHERAVVEQLFLEKKIQILIATATLAWGINMPAHLVIVKGTEYYDGKTCSYVDFPVTGEFIRLLISV
ncbi:hypothetical protein WR25_24921 [Diploscapter pachys]|uniref:U5 small nuclear ribonucleoprotein 200 kDa helicase n=1 Tax=Diploscapter pachys TaxID=2018661 RepID=A0A2A2L0Q4_9BILA|nr:hypothetical protein WR25_24921 [Diploscapter pachys]